MPDKIINLKKKLQEKRQVKSWTLKEIKENASRELKECNKSSENEPGDLVSGDMQKAIEDKDNENGLN